MMSQQNHEKVWISGERRRSHQSLLDRAARAATGFAELGIGVDDAVAIVLRNDLAFVEASLAASMLGAYAVPINWHLAAQEVSYVLKDCGAKAAVIHSDFLAALDSIFEPDFPVIEVEPGPEIVAAYDVVVSPTHRPDVPRWEHWLDQYAPWTEPPSIARSSIIYTSGTTGRPKGVRRDPLNETQLATALLTVACTYGIVADSPYRTIITGPMYHSAPNGYAMLAAKFGAYTVLQPRFDPEELLYLVGRHRITHLLMVPTMFVRLLKLPEQVRARYDVSSLQWVTHGAAPCAPDVKRAMIEWWGPIIYEYYGSTETGLLTVATSEDSLARPGTVGRPLDGIELRIDDEDGNPAPCGARGEIYVWSNSYSDFEYHGLGDERRAIERDGLVSIGDVGYLDEEGYLYICDRKRDMVISGGVNIYPAEIEAELVGMPGLQDCAVFGIPDEEFGERLCAFIEPVPGNDLTAHDVQAFLRARLAGYKVPREIEICSELPREDSGKIFKRKLRDPYWRNVDRNI